MNILCFFGFHDWGKFGQQFQFGYTAYQNRKCKRCGKAQQKNLVGINKKEMYKWQLFFILQLKQLVQNLWNPVNVQLQKGTPIVFLVAL